MCWNAEVSLNTFLLATSICMMSIINRVMNVWWALFYMSYATIQLIEYFLWKNLDNPARNRIISFIGFIVICFQPIASILMLNGEKGKEELRDNLLLAYLVYLVIICFAILNTDIIKFNTRVASNGHLLWEWIPQNVLWMLPWMVLFFIPILMTATIVPKVFALSILVISYITYWKYHTWASMWCWFAGISSFYYLWLIFNKSGVCIMSKS